jgi:hypothetical protein
MADPLCLFHPAVKAHRFVPKVGYLCDPCFRKGPPWHAPDPVETFAPERKKQLMPKNKSAAVVDWPAIIREKQEGAPAGELAKKYGVRVANIYYHAAPSRAKKHLGDSRRAPSLDRTSKSARFAGAISELKAECDRIQGIISQLEAMG